MDQIKKLLDAQLTEREIIVFLILQSGKMSQRSLADALLTSHTTIKNTYNSAKHKFDKMSTIFSTPVEKVNVRVEK